MSFVVGSLSQMILKNLLQCSLKTTILCSYSGLSFFSFLVQLTSRKANFICSAVFCLACNLCCCKGKQLLQLFGDVPAVCGVTGVDLVALPPTGPVHYTALEAD